MNLDDVDQRAVEFEGFHGRFAQLFARSERREASWQYLCGLLASVRQKNCWQMAEAMVNGQLVLAGPDSPEKAFCPSCGGAVNKRKRRRMDGRLTYFYRHKRGVGEECQRGFHPYSTRRLR